MRYIVFLKPTLGMDADEFKGALNRADDWYRVGSYAWIIASDEDARTWSRRFRKFVEPDGHVFICRLDTSDRSGLMTKKFWEWMRKHDTQE